MTSSNSCTHCGKENRPEDLFCSACGWPIDLDAPVESDALPLLNERYRIEACIGKGGYGAVYKAIDIQDNKNVAIKQIHLKGLSAQEMIEATDTFNREARMLTRLRHPRLPKMYEQFNDSEHWYLVIDFIAGRTLEDFLEQAVGHERIFPVRDILDIGIQLCDVLMYLHTRKPPVIYRDLKPGNVIRDASGFISLIDFGVARHYKPEQQRDTIPLGSPGYAAPEQYGKAQTSPASDLYSLGVVLHQLLTNHDPAETLLALPPLELYDVRGGADLARLIENLTTLEQEQRPQKASEVAKELTRIKEMQVSELTSRVEPHVYRSQVPRKNRAQLNGPPSSFMAQQQLKQPVISRRGVVAAGGGLAVGALMLGGWLLRPQPQPVVTQSQRAMIPPTREQISIQEQKEMMPPSTQQFFYYHWSKDFRYVAKIPHSNPSHTVYIHDVATDVEISTFEIEDDPKRDATVSLFWSPNNSFIYALNAGRCLIWEVNSGRNIVNFLHKRDKYEFYGLKCAPDEKTMISTNYHQFFCWNIKSGKSLFEKDLQNGIYSVTWSSKNALFSLLNVKDMNLYIYNVNSRSLLRRIDLKKKYTFITSEYANTVWSETKTAWSPSNAAIALAVDNMLWLINLDDQEDMHILEDARDGINPVRHLSWSSDETYLAVMRYSTLEIWHSRQRKLIYKVTIPVISVLSWKDQRTIWGGDDTGKIHRWQIDDK